MLKALVILASLATSIVFANETCVRTEEYLTFRENIAKSLMKPSRECESATKDSLHWKAVANCVLDVGGKDPIDCDMKVRQRLYPSEEADITHCEVLKYSTEQFVEALFKSAQELDVSECKT